MAVKRSPARCEHKKHPYKQQLDYLYARRSKLDALIASLEEYDRFRAARLEFGRLKTA